LKKEKKKYFHELKCATNTSKTKVAKFSAKPKIITPKQVIICLARQTSNTSATLWHRCCLGVTNWMFYLNHVMPGRWINTTNFLCILNAHVHCVRVIAFN